MKSPAIIKRLLYITAGLLLFLIMAYKAFFYFDHRAERSAVERNRTLTRLTNEELGKIHEGDIILRRGFGIVSDYVATRLNPEGGKIDVTHAGIITQKNGQLFVIHALSSDVSDIDGLQIQPLTEFLTYSEPGKIIITRAKGSDEAFGKNVVVQAYKYLKMHIPFDHNGVIDDDSHLFCTELVWKILEKDLHYSKLPTEAVARKNFFYSMAPMYSTDYFDIIINQYEVLKK